MSFLSIRENVHLHDYGRKGNPIKPQQKYHVTVDGSEILHHVVPMKPYQKMG